jgi:DNA primase
MIPEDKVREISERLSIVEVVSDYVELKRSGSNYLGLCPFHGEKTPSFNVNPAREIFHCFGCGAGGNIFSFVMKMDGLSFPEAVKLLARKAGVEIEERQLTPAEKQAESERLQFQRINELVAGFYREILLQKPEGAAARKYLEERSASGEVAEAYGIGFAADRRDAVVQHLRSNSASLETAAKLGIIRKNESGWYDLFRNRLIFPIRDIKGNVIAFAGRVLDNSLPKYINSPESPLYHKSSVLFGIDLALQSVRTENSIILVEGYFDHLALYKAGIKNAVATCGTALTASHISLIKKHAARVYTLFDGDSAGRKATIRSMELFLEHRLPAYVITLPPGDDPDSFLAGNPVEAFRQNQQKSRPVFEYFVRSLLNDTPADSVDNKVRLIDEIAPRFRKIADPVERDLYEKEICRLIGITSHAFRKRLGGMAVTSRDLLAEGSTAKQQGDLRQETLLALISGYPEARQRVLSEGVEHVFDGIYLELARLMLDALSGGQDRQVLGYLMEQIDNREIKMLLSRLLVSDEHMADIDWRQAYDHCQRGREKKALGSIKEIAARMAVLEPGCEEYQLLLKQADELRNRKSKL